MAVKEPSSFEGRASGHLVPHATITTPPALPLGPVSGALTKRVTLESPDAVNITSEQRSTSRSVDVCPLDCNTPLP